MEAVRGAWSILTGHVGDVRVDFAQPFSIQVCSIGADQTGSGSLSDTGVPIEGNCVRILSSRTVSLISSGVCGQPLPEFSS